MMCTFECEFVAEAGDAMDGLRGVVWALLNTKEFILIK